MVLVAWFGSFVVQGFSLVYNLVLGGRVELWGISVCWFSIDLFVVLF